MALKSMKLTRSEAKDDVCCEVSAPKYPWGLSINLDEESISKLDLSDIPEVGKEMTIIATVKVEDVSSRETSDGEKKRSVGLQITEMSLEQKASDDTLEKLYGES